MNRFARFLSFAIVAAFAVAGSYALRGDLVQISIAPLMRSWDLVLLAVFLSLSNYALRILRWRQYLSRLGHSLSLRFASLTYVAGFAFSLSPGKVGEVARARYYSRLGIPLADVAGAFFIERLMDLLAMLVLAALILAAAPRYEPFMWTAGGLVALCLVLLAALPWPVIEKALRKAGNGRVLSKFAASAARALCAARGLLKPGILLYGVLIGLAAWGMEGVGLYVLGGIFPAAHMGIAVGIGIYAVAVLVGALSFLPGGLGSTEAVMTALLVTQGFSLADALLATLACRLVTLWLAVFIGWAAVFILRQRVEAATASW